MEISIPAFIVLSLIYFIVAHIGLYKIFEKIGIEGWKALVPFYSTYIACKTIKKSWLWIITYYVPFLGFVVWMGIIVELMKLLGKTSFKEHFLGVVFAPIYLPYIGFKEDVKFIGYEEAAKYKKSTSREWADAIVFAVVAATLIRGIYLEAFTIPTSSMEQKLLRGDFLFVNKLAYGARIPMTPIAVPFTHHSFPEWIPLVGGKKSFSEIISFPYTKLPEMGAIERNDCVVFNFPAGDTVALEAQDRVYDQLVRDMGRTQVWNKYTIAYRPIDKRENYIKRCVGLPGDKIEIIDGVLKVNEETAYQDPGVQHRYIVHTKDYELSKKVLLDKKINYEFPVQEYMNPETGAINVVDFWRSKDKTIYNLTMTEEARKKLQQFPNVVNIEQIIDKQDSTTYADLSIFPNSNLYNWTVDNFGPLTIPKKGTTVELNEKTFPIYKVLITRYELNDLQVKDGKIFINGEETTSYTFKMNYYWMMGDNRNNSLDSRYWGFVPEDHIVGKAVFVWMSYSPHPEEGGFFSRIRWDRLFTKVH
ncbi:MAG: signal peptidase I [Flavobacteriales bacterium]|nr:signal peptidase I [Flavobacteriales bacterium]MCW8912016.1 signal peptidase I [Flavobacteriales bacterium]MCW8936656.1 signal peptidase I [Flavobacteriales bacterium]MCW8939555.1 signal peptidase I [Flavobacteriales bacterium]MCW8969604.1 signal peptidase I [Flavobacteriales bacterium]